MKLITIICTTILLTLSANVYGSQTTKPSKALKTVKKASKKAKNPKVVIKTSEGTMTVELYPKKAPETVKNFLHYVESGFYKNTLFHRIINNFMIQGGGYKLNKAKTPELKPTKPPIKNEGKSNLLKNERGTIAMARTGAPHLSLIHI